MLLSLLKVPRLCFVLGLGSAGAACLPAGNPCAAGDLGCTGYSSYVLYQFRDASTAELDCLLDRDRIAPGITTIDINPGTGASNAQEFICLNDRILFQADDGTHGAELWSTDGTAAGTMLLMDIQPGATGSTPRNFARMGDVLFFGADNGTNGEEVWRTDGTAAGTYLLHDVNPGAGASTSQGFLELNGLIYFHAFDGSSNEVHSTDGITLTNLTGTDPDYGGGSGSATVLAGQFFFWDGDHNTLNRELYSYGPAAGLTFLQDILVGGAGSFPTELTAFHNMVLLQGDDGGATFGSEIRLSSGTDFQTIDFNPGTASSTPQYFFDFGDRALLRATNGSGTGLAATDGTSAGTTMITTTVQPFDTFAGLNGSAYFNGFNGGEQELWVTDGSAGGTSLVADLNSGGSSSPNKLTATDSYLVFRANGTSTGNEFYVMDTNRNVTLYDISPGAGGSLPDNLYAADELIFFRATDTTNGYELRVFKQ